MQDKEMLQKNFDIQRTINALLELGLKNLPLPKILDRTLDMILEIPWLAPGSTGSIFMLRSGSEILEMKAERGIEYGLKKKCRRIRVGQCLCGSAAKKKEIVFASKIDKRHIFLTEKSAPHGHYCVPIVYSGKVLGVINIYLRDGYRDGKTEREFLRAIANTLSGIIQRRRAEIALERSNLALRTLSECNHTLVHTKNEQELLKKICRIIVEVSGYKMAWIGIAQNDPYKSVAVAAQYGTGKKYLKTAKISWDAGNPRSHGPTGTAIRTNRISINRNFQKDSRLSPWRRNAVKHGFFSSLALPLRSKSFSGALTIYAGEPDAFDQKEIKLMKELADDLAFGLTSIRIREAHKKADSEKAHVEKKLLESYKHLGSINRQIAILLDLHSRSGGKNAREILSYILNSAINLSQTDAVSIFRYDRKRKCLVKIESETASKKEFCLSSKKHSFLRPLFEKRSRVQGLFIKELHTAILPGRDDIQYFLFLPLLSGKKLKGAIVFGFPERETITTQELDFYEAFAAQSSLVLKSLDIFKEKRPGRKKKSQYQLDLFSRAYKK